MKSPKPLKRMNSVIKDKKIKIKIRKTIFAHNQFGFRKRHSIPYIKSTTRRSNLIKSEKETTARQYNT